MSHRRVAKLARQRKRGPRGDRLECDGSPPAPMLLRGGVTPDVDLAQDPAPVGEGEIPGDTGDADHEKRGHEQSLPEAGGLVQLVEAPQQLRLLLRAEGPAMHQLLYHAGETLGVAAIPALPAWERQVGSGRVDLDSLFVLIHLVAGA